MNLLGHAFLSPNDTDILCGNMMGDFVKGKKILDTFPEKIKIGLLLHRSIDSFTDHHPSVIKAANIFRMDYHLYSGSIIDIVFDHFLANDPKFFPSKEALSTFTQKVYGQLKTNEASQPEPFKRLSHFLEQEDILFQYHSLKGLKKALEMLCRRMKIETNHEKAWENSMRYYYELNQYYFDFIKDIVSFVKNELK